MTGLLARAIPVVALLLVAAAQTQGQTQRFPAFDPERIFMLGDADLDGQLSLEEYRYAGRDMRLTDVKGVVHKAILA